MRLHAEARQQSKEVLRDQTPQPASGEVPHDQQPERPDMDIAQTPQTVTPSEHAEVILPQQRAEFSLSTLTPQRRSGRSSSAARRAPWQYGRRRALDRA